MDVITLHQKSDKYILTIVLCHRWALLEGQYFQTVTLSLNKGKLYVSCYDFRNTLGQFIQFISEITEIA